MKLSTESAYQILDIKTIIALKEFFAEQHKYEIASEFRSIERFYESITMN